MKVIGVVLIVVGLFFLARPAVEDYFLQNAAEELLDDWPQHSQISAKDQGAPPLTSRYNEEESLSAELLRIEEQFQNESPAREVHLTEVNKARLQQQMKGHIAIPAINVEVPLFYGVDVTALEYGAAYLSSTAAIGEAGNAAIAAHRSHAYGRNFNRLNEVETGQPIEIETMSGRFLYQITDITVVAPEQVEVLLGTKKKKEITLITCHPVENPTHRLIVKGEFIEETR
ncbi:class D sortase [Salsuginibacillus kocurii]|uniref:class D sortase n=1 Tax=Salsuginibacillus kocurii TaxID=427078 RepID=UPI00035F1E03|nr:class D sortase [Salsuginibacillus kocurii]